MSVIINWSRLEDVCNNIYGGHTWTPYVHVEVRDCLLCSIAQVKGYDVYNNYRWMKSNLWTDRNRWSDEAELKILKVVD